MKEANKCLKRQEISFIVDSKNGQEIGGKALL